LSPDTFPSVDAAYSRDGQWLFFNATSGCGHLFRAHADGTQPIATGPGTCGGVPGLASSSPDGARAAVWNQTAGLGVLDVATNQLSYIVACPCPNYLQAPRWSPDGTRIAFVSNQLLWLTTPAGATPTPATPAAGPFENLDFDWSADSQWLIARRGQRLALIRVSDGTVLPLGYSEFMHWPTWKP
jgi:Tol biopolymer transport system component